MNSYQFWSQIHGSKRRLEHQIRIIIAEKYEKPKYYFHMIITNLKLKYTDF